MVQVLIAGAGVYVTIRPPEPKKHKRYTAIFVVLLLAGLTTTILQRLRSSEAHQVEMHQLKEFLKDNTDKVIAEIEKLRSGQPSVSVVKPGVPAKPLPRPSVPSEVKPSPEEVARRSALVKALRDEYILSHDGISPAMMAGLEWPPVE